MQHRAASFLLLFCVGMASVGCALRAVDSIERGDPGYESRVLVATQQSAFKEAVVSRLAEDLEKGLCYVKVIDLKGLKKEPTANYDAIVLVNTCKAWSLSRGASGFLKNFRDTEKVVLLTTATGEDWTPKSVEVDAITSASRMHKAVPVAEEIVQKVRRILQADQRSL